MGVDGNDECGCCCRCFWDESGGCVEGEGGVGVLDELS